MRGKNVQPFFDFVDFGAAFTGLLAFVAAFGGFTVLVAFGAFAGALVAFGALAALVDFVVLVEVPAFGALVVFAGALVAFRAFAGAALVFVDLAALGATFNARVIMFFCPWLVEAAAATVGWC